MTVLSPLATSLLLVVLIVAAVLLAFAMLGTNPFTSLRMFAFCASMAFVIAVLVVGAFSLTDGLPYIKKI